MDKRNYSYHNANGDDGKKGSGDGDGGCCSVSCLKFSLHLFNILFFLTGLVMVAVGLKTLMDKHPSLALLNSGLYDLAGYVFVVAGGIILITAVLGCIGLCRDSRTQILTYAVLLAFIFVLEAAAGGLCYVYRGKVGSELAGNLQEKFARGYGIDNDTTAAVDHLQRSLACCGVNTFEDWQTSDWWGLEERRNNKVPDSCCITPGRYCGVRDHPSNIRYTGCIDRIEKIAGDNLLIIGAVALGICVIQLLGVVMACLLHCKIKDRVFLG